ncbi:MAG: hypothetical protein ACRCTN_03255 [Carnobacterium maltaromaticum]
MKFVMERTVNGVSKFSVVEAGSPMEAMHTDMSVGFLKDEQRIEEIRTEDVALVGVYEVGQVNHLEAINKEFELHRFYQETQATEE